MRRPGTTTVLTGTALLLALGIILPITFHMLPLGGRIFLPMHLPAFIAGLLLGPVSGLVVGAGSPLMSLLLTGRPPIYLAVPMMFEIATYGIVAGLLRPRIESVFHRATGTDGTLAGILPLHVTLIAAMLAGRIVWLAVVVWLAPVIGISGRSVALALGAIGAGWIGVAIQLALIPAIVRVLEAGRPGNRTV